MQCGSRTSFLHALAVSLDESIARCHPTHVRIGSQQRKKKNKDDTENRQPPHIMSIPLPDTKKKKNETLKTRTLSDPLTDE